MSLTASATSKRCGGYREPNDATLTSREIVNQISAARRASPKSLSPTNGNSMFLDAVEIEPQIQFSGLERGGLQKQKCFFRSQRVVEDSKSSMTLAL